ncbi:hypothetical protein F2Q68_00010804 [Brassica cretica]|uniref:U-box domain-containing protein n=2 Tax=Brassica cretica TaxID=69181 RepID=A0A8S9KV85_BRACR|nr:hypothetical protein F2Q68_00010804 [Brassica cretica]
MAEEDLECVRWLLWDSVASYEALVLCGASSGVIKLFEVVYLGYKGLNIGKKDAAAALSNLCIYQGNKGRAVRAGIVPALVKMLSDSSSHRMVDEALTILSAMAEENLECGRWLLWDSVASYEALVLWGASSGVIKLWNPLSRTDAGLNIVPNYIFLLQGNKGRAVRAGIVPALVKMLSDSSSHRMVDEALTILSVLESNLDAKAVIVKANTLPALIGILQTGQARNRENAAAILLSLCKRDNEKLVAIGRLGAVVPLMDLTKNGTERRKRKATSLLEILRKACQ